MLSSPFDEVDEKLPLLLFSAKVDGRDGDPIGVSVGDTGCDRVEIANIELVASFCAPFLASLLVASTFAVSVVTTGLAAEANECDRIALGGCGRFCTPVDEALSVLSIRLWLDLASFLAVRAIGSGSSKAGMLMVLSSLDFFIFECPKLGFGSVSRSFCASVSMVIGCEPGAVASALSSAQIPPLKS